MCSLDIMPIIVNTGITTGITWTVKGERPPVLFQSDANLAGGGSLSYSQSAGYKDMGKHRVHRLVVER